MLTTVERPVEEQRHTVNRRTRKQAVVAVPATPLAGDELRAAVTDAMVALHEHYHHRKPVTAKTTMLGGDLIACVLGGVYTDVEKTMIEIQQKTIVQETRNACQNAMQNKFVNAIEDLSDRKVLAFISNHHAGPDIELEIFFLTPTLTTTDPPNWPSEE